MKFLLIILLFQFYSCSQEVREGSQVFAESSSSTQTTQQQSDDPIDEGPTPILFDNISVDNLAFDSVTLSWDTNVQTRSWIEFGETPDLGEFLSDDLDNYFLEHSLQVNDLEANTMYYFRIGTEDLGGIREYSQVLSFKTEAIRISVECSRQNPSLSIVTNQPIITIPGGSSTVQVTLRNNNLNCDPATYNFNYINMPNMINSIVANKTLNSGESITFNITFTTRSTLAPNLYMLNLQTTDIEDSQRSVLTSFKFLVQNIILIDPLDGPFQIDDSFQAPAELQDQN